MAAPARLTAPAPVRHPIALTLLRIAALDCRAAARLDVGHACAALDPAADAADLATLLARALPVALRHRPQLGAPGTRETSFDEDWLLALSAAIARGDRASERFLLARRCHAHRAPHLALLIRAYADRLDRAAACGSTKGPAGATRVRTGQP